MEYVHVWIFVRFMRRLNIDLTFLTSQLFVETGNLSHEIVLSFMMKLVWGLRLLLTSFLLGSGEKLVILDCR